MKKNPVLAVSLASILSTVLSVSASVYLWQRLKNTEIYASQLANAIVRINDRTDEAIGRFDVKLATTIADVRDQSKWTETISSNMPLGIVASAAGSVVYGNGLKKIEGEGGTRGHWNTAIGWNALLQTTTGYGQTAIGYNALRDSGNALGPTGVGVFGNTAIGYNSMVVNSDGFDNTAVGVNSLLNNQTGDDNVAIGVHALRANRGGFDNTAVGFDTLMYVADGEGNVAVGGEAGRFLVTGEQKTGGENSIYLGRLAWGGPINTADNEIVIGANARGKGSNTIVLGSDAIQETYLRGEIFINGVSLREYLQFSAAETLSSQTAD